VGSQDVAWDVAGAAVEFDLNPDERARLVRAVGTHAGYEVDRALLALLEPCYLAFQLGAWSLAADDGGDGQRARVQALVYRSRLEGLLARG
jgi:hypothetical protein